jgi:sn-1 stearoyl-lipid 9-desaturase
MFEFAVAFILFYIWHALGVTVGYHRLLSHRAFTTSKPVEYFWVLGGYLAFEGSPIWWATIHRAHHRYTDTPLDPHSPRYGLRYAHMGWLKERGYKSYVNPNEQSKDLVTDPVYSFLEQGGNWHRAHVLAIATGIAFRIIVLLCVGWQVAFASLLAGLAVLQIPLMLNIVCHLKRFGYKTYATDDDSVNVWWVAILAMGEGWHNNHHASPGSARSGMRAWEIDASWFVIKLMKRLGLARNVHVSTHRELLRRMAAKRRSTNEDFEDSLAA